MKYCIQLDERDNVATVLARVEPGDTLEILNAHMVPQSTILSAEGIPFAHKIGLRDIRAGEDVTKYGERIGRATRFIATGSYVHVHNVTSVEGTVNAKQNQEQGAIG
ncbi:MAG: UxaA family hydrolase [Clostridiales bacterium]|nr:UxaA family hydrolase [Clostridiales bacterium]